MNPVLETKGLSFYYSGAEKGALENVNIKIQQGKRTAILGANGAGKSTLFHHFNGIYEPSVGTVEYCGEPIRYGRKHLRKLRSEVAVVLQNPDDQIFCSTVKEDVAFGPKNLGLDEKEIKDRVDEAMFQTGITSLADKGTLRLSYGQRKRLALAGAIAMKPKVLILDEPTAGMDPQMSHEVMELTDRLHNSGTTIVISTHDVDLAYIWADEMHVLRRGKLVYSGTSEGFYSKPEQVHLTGLIAPSIFDINRNWCDMNGREHAPFPRTLPELVSKISGTAKIGRLTIIPLRETLSADRLSELISSANMRIGLYGTCARRAVYEHSLKTDFVFNGLESCLSECIGGRDAMLLCDEGMMNIVRDKIDNLVHFGVAIDATVKEPGKGV